MKRLLIALVLLWIVRIPAFAGGGDKTADLKWVKIDAGITEAKKTNKKILLDVYTDWCKWCKKLDAEVYEESRVAEYLRKHYVTVKLNAESGTKVTFRGKQLSESDLAQSLGVTGYPTIIFLDPQGEPIDRLGGFVDAEKFLPMIKYIGEDAYKTTKWEDYMKKSGK